MFFTQTPEWQQRGDRLVAKLLEKLSSRGLREERLGLVIVTPERGRPVGYAWRGDWVCYPCSLVKTFHLVHALELLDQGVLTPHEDLDRAMRDMILWSSNTATNYVIDLITGTTGDTLLSGAEFAEWRDRREALNRYFRNLGWREFDRCNITQKLMDDTRYGREAQYAGRDRSYLNALTPLSAARLMWELFEGDLPLTPASRARAQAELRRDLAGPEAGNSAYQVTEFLGGGLPTHLPYWSKAGHNTWTGDPHASYFKHDMIRFQPDQGPAVIAVVMTQGKELSVDNPEAFHDIGRILVEHLAEAEVAA